MMKKIITPLLLSFLITDTAGAQRPCASEEYEQFLRANGSQYGERSRETSEAVLEYRKTGPAPKPHSIVTIPVVFHVVWQTSQQNLSDACLIDQVASLNRDFRKMNADLSLAPSQFQSIAADVEFEFCLASKDPQGNPTNGIVRKQTTATFGVNDNIKFNSSGGSNIWDKNTYLNIWIGEIGNVGGFSPKGCSSASTDGVVIHWAEVGNCDKITNGDQGRTAVHEVGHWMGLSHTFQGGCSGTSASDCASAGDYVCDTPPVAQQSFSSNCSSQPNTCTETPADQPDMIWNHMDYTHPKCKVLFTNGQKSLMYASTSSCRSAIYNGTAAAAVCSAATGIAENKTEPAITLYPNPVHDLSVMDFDNINWNRARINVINLHGQNMLADEIQAPHYSLDASAFSPGVYFYRITEYTGKTYHGKFTKQ